MSLELLKVFQGPILKKIGYNRVVNVSEPSIANLADILFAYSMASPCMLSENENFVMKIEKAIQEKMILKDYFNTLNTTKIEWSLAKFRNRDLNPLFANDIAAVILPRNEQSKVKSVQHATFNEISTAIMKTKKHASTQNLALQLFSQASIDLHNPDFFEAAFL